MDENAPHRCRSRPRLGAILWPLLLIAFGVLLLLENLGLLGQSAWSLLWNLWPLLFIAIGIDSLFRKLEIFGPVFWLGLGGVLLLNNFGPLGWQSWNALFRLWPLLLVTAGLDLLLARRSLWVSLPASLGVLVVLAVALGLTGVRLPVDTITLTEISEPLGQAGRAELTISMAGGELNLFTLEDSTALIAGEINASKGAGVHLRTDTRGETAIYALEHGSPMIFPFDHGWHWQLGLTPKIPLALEAKQGAGAMSLTLPGLTLETLKVNQGVGGMEVNAPAGAYRIEISQAMGQIILTLPPETPILLEVNRALTGLTLPPDFEQRGGAYYSPGAAGAENPLRIQIGQAIGSIIIRYGE